VFVGEKTVRDKARAHDGRRAGQEDRRWKIEDRFRRLFAIFNHLSSILKLLYVEASSSERDADGPFSTAC
jgi:hypothetical protein